MKRESTAAGRGLLLLLCLFLATAPASAAITLHFTPADAAVDPGAGGRLSLMIDDPVEVRTIDLVVQYDPLVVESIGGSAGALYTDSGIFTFKGFENESPGEWHGYAVLMGAGLYIQGPGELFYWDFEGLMVGRSPVLTISVSLAATDGSWYPDVTVDAASIIVGDPSGLPADPGRAGACLRISPNPFNPRTMIELPPGDGQRAVLSVLDARGRLVKELWSGIRTGGTARFVWNGEAENGRSAGSGTYLFVLKQEGGSGLVGRGSLVR